MARGRAFRGLSVTLVTALAALALPADAAPTEPIEHEFVAPDPGEDLALSITTPEGDLPAMIDTSNGVVPAPDTTRPPAPEDHAYASVARPNAPDSFRPDRDTRQPDHVSYDDPFSPSLSPYKRLRAFDAVGADYALSVHDPAVRPLAVGGALAPGEESFYGDMTVDLEPGELVRIPSVGPGARLLRMHTTPDTPVTVLRNGADEWFVKSPRRGRVRLIAQLALARSAFGGEFGTPSWAELPSPAVLPPNVAAAAAKVAAAIGVSREMSPHDVVGKLVDWFRAFEPSDDPPHGRGDIYLDLALSKKGVCRHRAFAFLVTALGLRIPARMVVNEAHAWVEVSDGSGFHRIDLGGAAGDLDEPPPDGRPAYAPPPDPYPWPETDATSGQRLAERARGERAAHDPRNGSWTASQQGGGSGDAGTRFDPVSRSSAPGDASSDAGVSRGDRDERPSSRIVVRAADGSVKRGMAIAVGGTVEANGSPCAHLRVDVALGDPKAGRSVPVGSLATDGDGKFDGAVVLPLEVPVGLYDLTVTTPGDMRCGPGIAR